MGNVPLTGMSSLSLA